MDILLACWEETQQYDNSYYYVEDMFKNKDLKYEIGFFSDYDIRKALYSLYYLRREGIAVILKTANMTQSQLARRFGIPIRTVQDWYSKRRTPPDYVLLMMFQILIWPCYYRISKEK